MGSLGPYGSTADVILTHIGLNENHKYDFRGKQGKRKWFREYKNITRMSEI